MKKGIVLFTTMLLILSLMSIILIFLNTTKDTKDKITQEFALIQTNLIMKNLSSYFNNIQFDEEKIFYGSKMPFSLDIYDSNINFTIDSMHKYLNINVLAKMMIKKDNKIYDDFISYLYKYNLREPEFFVDLLLDTIDKDNIEINSGSHSEISINNPRFRNGKIYNKTHFQIILDYYYFETNDKSIYNIPFDSIVAFNSSEIDINFATKELLKMFFYDANQYSLDMIINNNQIYEKIANLPFDENYIKEISKGRFGHKISTTSVSIKVKVELNYLKQFSSKVEFIYNTKTKKLTDYVILDIIIN